MQSLLLSLAVLSGLAAAKDIPVSVGASGLVFSPNSVTANPGDVLQFKIYPTHNVAQSSFAKPCVPLDSNAIFSGQGATTFAVTVNSTTPLWFYCATASHCEDGMVFAVNPTANATFDEYKSAAASVSASMYPAAVGGGIINGTLSSSSSSGSNSTSSSMTSMTSSAAGSTGSTSAGGSSSMGGSSGTSTATSAGTANTGTSGTGTSSSASGNVGSFATAPPAIMLVAGGLLGAAYLL